MGIILGRYHGDIKKGANGIGSSCLGDQIHLPNLGSSPGEDPSSKNFRRAPKTMPDTVIVADRMS
jgi:hypothetical protein